MWFFKIIFKIIKWLLHSLVFAALFWNILLMVYIAHEELHVGIGNEPNIRKKCQPCKYLVCTVFKSWNMKFVNNFCYVMYICTCTYHLLKIRFTTKQNVCDGQINVCSTSKNHWHSPLSFFTVLIFLLYDCKYTKISQN